MQLLTASTGNGEGSRLNILRDPAFTTIDEFVADWPRVEGCAYACCVLVVCKNRETSDRGNRWHMLNVIGVHLGL